MDPGVKTDGVIIHASAASMLRGRLHEWGGATEGAAVEVRGRTPGNVLEFKRANYPEKQSGTSCQEI